MEKEMRIGWLAGPASAAAIVLLAACGSSGGGGTNTSAPAGGSGGGSSSNSAPAGPSSVVVKIKKTPAGMVLLTNASGFTLYTFQADQGSTSTCYGRCAQFWPPVFGSAHLAAGQNVNGRFGTTTRKDGKTQVTYDGHPLYTYAGDTKPGDTKGNNINQDGGIWNIITIAAGGGASSGGGSTPSPAPSAASSGGGGGGYGY
jgi:predicted lipoprotein with Yx(FWY)xxD motif